MTPDLFDPKTEVRLRLYSLLSQVPAGTVVSYGQLGELAGLGRAARWVGRTLSQLPADTQLPWHRVVRANGQLSLPLSSRSGALQKERLLAEGIVVVGDKLNIRRYRWHPGPS